MGHHCRHCGAVLAELTFADGKVRQQCGRCGEVAWRNPLPVGMALVEHEGRLVLIRRLADPLAGYWAPPAASGAAIDEWFYGVVRDATARWRPTR